MNKEVKLYLHEIVARLSSVASRIATERDEYADFDTDTYENGMFHGMDWAYGRLIELLDDLRD